MQARRRLTYANVVSTLALFVAVTGGTVYAASKIQTGDIANNAVKAGKIAPGAVHTANIYRRAITTGKLGLNAVRNNQLANGAVGSAQIQSGSVAPSDLQFPVHYVARPTGGSAPVTNGPTPYPLSDNTWTQNPGQIIVVFGGATGTLAYTGSGSGSCQVNFEISQNDQQVGGGGLSTSSTSPVQVQQTLGAQPEIDPAAPTPNQLTVRIGSNGDCTNASTIDSARFRVLDFG